MTTIPCLKITSDTPDTSIPFPLITALRSASQKDFVHLSQHGYTHDANLSFYKIRKGYRVLTDAGLDINYYTPPLESDVNKTLIMDGKELIVFKTRLKAHYMFEPKIDRYKEGYVSYGESTYPVSERILRVPVNITYNITYNWTDKNYYYLNSKRGLLPPGICPAYCRELDYALNDDDIICVQPANMTCPYNFTQETVQLTEQIYYNKTEYDYDIVAVIHIQDNITAGWLTQLESVHDFDILRIDDINTNYVNGTEITIRDQIERISTATKYCYHNNCTLVLAVIPLSKRPFHSDELSEMIAKGYMVITTFLLFILYLFYLISFVLFKLTDKFKTSKTKS